MISKWRFVMLSSKKVVYHNEHQSKMNVHIFLFFNFMIFFHVFDFYMQIDISSFWSKHCQIRRDKFFKNIMTWKHYLNFFRCHFFNFLFRTLLRSCLNLCWNKLRFIQYMQNRFDAHHSKIVCWNYQMLYDVITKNDDYRLHFSFSLF